MYSRSRLIILLLLCLCVMPFALWAQSYELKFSVMSYNVENLFDTIHDEGKNDLDFTPMGNYRWNSWRLHHKMEQLARVIASSGADDNFPVLVGLCEVENDTVLTWLTRRSSLWKAGYRYVMTDSPDLRGVDVALLYNPLRFRLLGSESIRVPSAAHGFRPTRDILHAWGMLPTGDTLDVMVTHLPSRAGGTGESSRHRALAARTLRDGIDSLYGTRTNLHLLVMGDFNAEPDDVVFRKYIRPLPASSFSHDNALYTLMPTTRKALRRPEGTYKYQGRWQYIDHILVTGNLLDANAALSVTQPSASVVNLPVLLEEDTKYGGSKPFRIFQGVVYHGGISDHLPLTATFRMLLH